MNVLDENIPTPQRLLLRKQRVAVRQIGHDLGREGMSDEDIIPFLHGLRRATFFTRDVDYFSRKLCHERYCLVWLDIEPPQVAEYVRRFLRHRAFNTQAKRLGSVIAVSPSGLSAWQLHAVKATHLTWEGK